MLEAEPPPRQPSVEKSGDDSRLAVHALVGALVVLGVLGASPVALSPVADASPSLAFVSGTVKDDGGTPLAGAVVA